MEGTAAETELDYILSGAAIGKKSECKARASIALAVDADSGIVFAPEVTDSSVPAGDTLARVFLKAIQANRSLSNEVRVRSQRVGFAVSHSCDRKSHKDGERSFWGHGRESCRYLAIIWVWLSVLMVKSLLGMTVLSLML
jgi:hypothetical protein